MSLVSICVAALNALALFALGLFTGTCFYTSFIGHPMRLRDPHPHAIRNFRDSVSRSAFVQPLLLLVAIGATAASFGLDFQADASHALLVGSCSLCVIIMAASSVLISQLRAKLHSFTHGSELLEKEDVESLNSSEDAMSIMLYFAKWHRLRSYTALLAYGALIAGVVAR